MSAKQVGRTVRVCHSFDAPRDAVLDALASASYAHELAAAHSFFEAIDVLAIAERAGLVERTLRYRARPFLRRLGMLSLPPSWFVWVEHATLDRARGLLTFENVPELASVRAKVVQRGTMEFHAEHTADGTLATVREAVFEVGFDVAAAYRPLAELALSMVCRQLESALDEEARLLAAWLGRAGHALRLSA